MLHGQPAQVLRRQHQELVLVCDLLGDRRLCPLGIVQELRHRSWRVEAGRGLHEKDVRQQLSGDAGWAPACAYTTFVLSASSRRLQPWVSLPV